MIATVQPSFRYVITLLILVASCSAQEPQAGARIESAGDKLRTAEETLLRWKSQKEPRDINQVRTVERQLTSILQLEPATVFRQQIEADLELVHENLAYHDLLIATFYMGRTHGHSLRKAASRLERITQQYPKFSKMDEVLWRLAQVALAEEPEEKASAWLWRLVCNYPSSEYTGKAFEQLNRIGVKSGEGCESFKP